MDKMKQEVMTFSTKREVTEIKELLRSFAQKEKKCRIDALTSEPDPFGEKVEKAAIEVLVSGEHPWKWAVQVYVDDVGSQRDVSLVALGNSGLMIVAGAYTTVRSGVGSEFATAPNIKQSRKMQHKIAKMLS